MSESVYGRRPKVYMQSSIDEEAKLCVKVKQLSPPTPTTWDTSSGPLPMWSYNEVREWEMQQEMNKMVREGKAPKL